MVVLEREPIPALPPKHARHACARRSRPTGASAAASATRRSRPSPSATASRPTSRPWKPRPNRSTTSSSIRGSTAWSPSATAASWAAASSTSAASSPPSGRSASTRRLRTRGVGRLLMEAMLERADARQAPGVRLVQIAYHNRSLCLYTKLGFDVRATFAALHGEPLGLTLPGYRVRRAYPDDQAECDALCVRVHGHDRSGELGRPSRRARHASSSTSAASRATRPASTTGITRSPRRPVICRRSSAPPRTSARPASSCRSTTASSSAGAWPHGLRVYFVTNLMTRRHLPGAARGLHAVGGLLNRPGPGSAGSARSAEPQVVTVLGTLPARALGTVDAHEHLFIASAGDARRRDRGRRARPRGGSRRAGDRPDGVRRADPHRPRPPARAHAAGRRGDGRRDHRSHGVPPRRALPGGPLGPRGDHGAAGQAGRGRPARRDASARLGG